MMVVFFVFAKHFFIDYLRKDKLSPGVTDTDHVISPYKYDCLFQKIKKNARGRKCFRYFGSGRLLEKAFLLTSSGSLTVEAAVVVPVFAAAMAAVMQFANVYGTAARLGSILAQTGEEMAIGAYASEYTNFDSPLPVVLSAGYASAKIAADNRNTACIRGENLLLSSFLEKDDRIDLVLTYQVQSPSGLLKIPWIVFLQRASVRGWVGRSGSGSTGSETDGDGHDHGTVYVTEYGQVYHEDPDCTHIHLSIRLVTRAQAEAARNVYGEKYHVCEKCGGGDGNAVYITSDGNRYHSSLECSGLKRSVREMTREEAGNLRPCSKCAGG